MIGKKVVQQKIKEFMVEEYVIIFTKQSWTQSHKTFKKSSR